jgi:hypothetical protein
MFIIAIITIALIGVSQSNHDNGDSGKIVTVVEKCQTFEGEKKCKLTYK